MKRIVFFLLCGFVSLQVWSQTKVGGMVYDQNGEPLPFANVVFKNSTEGTITNENGRFYLDVDGNYDTLVVSFIGYTSKEISLDGRSSLNLEISLEEGEVLEGVTVYYGKTSKKNNPAIDILKKIWARQRKNGLNLYRQYQYSRYEKIEFDLNNVDSTFIQNPIFKGMEFVFEKVDTSRVTGKTYLPFFINEELSKVYGDNTLNKEKTELIANKNSGFESNQNVIAFVNDLYSDYNIYDNHLKFFDKSFTSPLSRTGIEVYNYVLSDSAYLDGKWCYNILFYPRRPNEMTFKGDFWVNDSTWAIKNINMQVSKNANINWVKDIYIEQDFEVVSDTVFLLKRDYFMSDFALRKREESKGIYGKRTTIYQNYTFNIPLPKDFYKEDPDTYKDPEIFQKQDSFWTENRPEKLSRDEKGIYEMLDTLSTVKRFQQISKLAGTLASGYFEFDKYNFDYGPIFSTFGFNDVEGVRFRFGGRTYFDANDPWRIEFFGAYGIRDQKFKYGISAKWLLDRKSRLTLSAGHKRDVEQTASSLTATTNVLGRSTASAALITIGDNSRLTNIRLYTMEAELEPKKNFVTGLGLAYRNLKSASPDTFSLEYIDPSSSDGISDRVRQSEIYLTLGWTPGRKPVGYGVERSDETENFAQYYIRVTQGFEGILESDFKYTKIQTLFTKPWEIGGFGHLRTTLELGKTFGEVPLGLLSVIPGNQTLLTVYNSFPTLNFYEFVTDTYVSGHLEHNFNGRLFARIPWIRQWNLREFVGLRAVWGDISQKNIDLNQPAFSKLTLNPNAIAPSDDVYWEYSVGVGNIFKILRIDFNFRGNYFDNIDARSFGVTFDFGFYF